MNTLLKHFKKAIVVRLIIAIFLFFVSWISNAQVDKNSELYKKLKSKDSIIFERTFNKCETEKLDPIISQDFEFYHDVTGKQNRAEFIKAIKENICVKPGNLTRQLVANSLEVFPLKNNEVLYGAIQKGKHTFLKKGKKIPEGIADFTHLWILEDNIWKLKRVLSYNHLPYIE